MVLAAYGLIAFWQYRHWCADDAPGGYNFSGSQYCYEVRDPLEIAMLAAATAGALVGFLWWNASPAKIFMGDTGSMAIGGMVAAMALATRTVLLLPIIGGLFVIITMSLIIQRVSYKTTGKRVFLMSPLHHHFELKGWSEVNVVIRFWIIAGIAAAIGLGIFYGDFLADELETMDERLTGRRGGAGVAGAAAARALLRRGAQVTVVDRAASEATERLAGAGARIVIADAPPDGLFDTASEVVVSPGFPPHHPVASAARAAGLEVYSEPELAWRLRGPGGPPWLAVTGTNGKTTTTTMLAAILSAAGHRVAAAGNLGEPLVDLAERPEVVAVELSSFQLHWSRTLAPRAGALLNLADDHLEWHGSFDAYAEAKTAVWRGAPVATVIGNADDPKVAARLSRLPGSPVTFTLSAPGPGQLGVADGVLVDRAFGEAELLPVDQVRPAGSHNVANALAAAALARAYGAPAAAVRAGLAGYQPEPHRNALGRVAGVTYVDDRRPPHAALASLLSYPRWCGSPVGNSGRRHRSVRTVAGRLVGAAGRGRAEIARALSRHAPAVPVVESPPPMTERWPRWWRAAPWQNPRHRPAGTRRRQQDMFTGYEQRPGVHRGRAGLATQPLRAPVSLLPTVRGAVRGMMLPAAQAASPPTPVASATRWWWG